MASSTKPSAEEVKAIAAATDNVGLFFGEDIFIAIGSILLIQAIAGELRLSNSTPLAAGDLGDPDRDLRLRDPRRAAAAARPDAAEGGAMITLELAYTPGRAMFAAFALLSVLDRSNASASATPRSGG